MRSCVRAFIAEDSVFLRGVSLSACLSSWRLFLYFVFVSFFFFQAEDGIRDLIVTGVQTCALPISSGFCSSALTKSHRCISPIATSSRATSVRTWLLKLALPISNRLYSHGY